MLLPHQDEARYRLSPRWLRRRVRPCPGGLPCPHQPSGYRHRCQGTSRESSCGRAKPRQQRSLAGKENDLDATVHVPWGGRLSESFGVGETVQTQSRHEICVALWIAKCTGRCNVLCALLARNRSWNRCVTSIPSIFCCG